MTRIIFFHFDIFPPCTKEMGIFVKKRKEISRVNFTFSFKPLKERNFSFITIYLLNLKINQLP